MKKERRSMWLLLLSLLVLLIATLLIAMQLDSKSYLQRGSHGSEAGGRLPLEEALNIAVKYLLNEELAQADKLLTETLIHYPESAECWMLSGSVCYRQRRYEKAEQAFRQTVKLQGNNAAAFNNLAESLVKLDRLDEAVNALSKAVELAPGNGEIWLNGAKLFARLQQDERALNFLQQALKNGAAAEQIARQEELVKLLERAQQRSSQVQAEVETIKPEAKK